MQRGCGPAEVEMDWISQGLPSETSGGSALGAGVMEAIRGAQPMALVLMASLQKFGM